jgi:hypothetical protein
MFVIRERLYAHPVYIDPLLPTHYVFTWNFLLKFDLRTLTNFHRRLAILFPTLPAALLLVLKTHFTYTSRNIGYKVAVQTMWPVSDTCRLLFTSILML